MRTKSFSTLAAWSAFVAGVAGLLYAISFVVLKNPLLYSIFLLVGGLASLPVWTSLYERFRDAAPPYALLAFVLSIGAAAGSIIHGGYDLSNALHPPASLNADLPSPIDPRGLLTFGVASLGLFFFAWLATKDRAFPAGLVYVGFASAILMAVLYLGRLIILNASSPAILLPAALEGFLLNPIWLIWLGVVLQRGK